MTSATCAQCTRVSGGGCWTLYTFGLDASQECTIKPRFGHSQDLKIKTIDTNNNDRQPQLEPGSHLSLQHLSAPEYFLSATCNT